MQVDAERAHPVADRAVGRHAAADRQPLEPGLGQCTLDADRQRLDDRALIGGGQIGPPAVGLLPEIAHLVEQGGLQPREREVEAGQPSSGWELERVRVAVASQPLERGAARIAEAEQPRALVERLAGGVVERLAETS